MAAVGSLESDKKSVSYTDKKAVLLEKDEMELLDVYRKAKLLGFSDIAVTIQEGVRVKLWLTHKLK